MYCTHTHTHTHTKADYAPPEVVFAQTDVPLSYIRPQSYDLWSVGVVFLELVLASSKVCARVEGLRPLL